MNTTFDSITAAAAWMASVAVNGAGAALPHDTHASARAALRSAQVEAYCDHDQAALYALRRARLLLSGNDPGTGQALALVDAASWHLRRHESAQAQAALEQARERLA